MATEALVNTSKRRASQRALAERLFDPSVPIRIAALCALSGLHPPFPTYLKNALIAKLDDPGRLDEHRVVADLARSILRMPNPDAVD